MATQIGCEDHDINTVRCYNQGSIEPYTCYDKDGVQVWNCPDIDNVYERYDWGLYDKGFMYYNRGIPAIKSFYDLPFEYDGYVVTNDTYKIRWHANFTAGLRRAEMSFYYTQSTFDDYVNQTYGLATLNSWGSFNREIHFYNKLHTIDIENDGDIDVLNYVNDSGIQGISLNFTQDTWINNTKIAVQVGDIDATTTGIIRWNYNQRRDIFIKAKGANNNSNVWWLVKSPVNFTTGFNKSMTEYWIDKGGCVFSCSIGCSYRRSTTVCANTELPIQCFLDYDRVAEVRIKLEHSCAFLPGGCNWGTGCYARIEHNWYGSNQNISNIEDEYDDTLVMSEEDKKPNFIGTWALNSSTAIAWSPKFNITCRQDQDDKRIQSYFEPQTSYGYRRTRIFCQQDTDYPNITLLTANNTEYEPGIITLESNSSDYYPISNMTLYHNLSGSMQRNQTIDVPLYPHDNYYHWNISIPLDTIQNITYQVESCDTNLYCTNSSYGHVLTKEIVLELINRHDKIVKQTPIHTEEPKCDLLCVIKKLFTRTKT